MRRSEFFQPVAGLLLIPAVAALLFSAGNDFVRIQTALVVAVLLATWAIGSRLSWSARPPRWCAPLRRWSRNSFLCCAIPAALSVVLRLVLLPWIPLPHPVVPDEFSHLFLAKTFALGRLANPPHPLWMHFETIHIISQPTYSSMYMAGQACFLALGKILTGSFFGGVVLSTALFCAALAWFLRGVVSPGWALFGGILAAVRFGAASYWNDSYWGGSVGALGGALVLGGWIRLPRNWSISAAFVFTAGAMLLANTRPYEGFGLTATLLVALVVRAFRRRAEVPWNRIRWSVAASLAMAVIAGWAMTRHWKAVTGSPFTFPYVVNERTYGWPLALPFTPVRQVAYRHQEMALYHDFEVSEHEWITKPDKIPIGLIAKISLLWLFFAGPILAPALLFADRILRNPRMRILWLAASITGLQVVTEQGDYPHYLSPAAPVVVLFLVRGLQYLSHWRPREIAFGPVMLRAVLPLMLLTIGVRAGVFLRDGPAAKPFYFSWCCTDSRIHDREPLERKLISEPGKHLVLVSYDLKKYDTFEWVYNEPDIDGSKIVFARDMGAEKNRELLDYFSDRRVWRVRIEGTKAYLLSDGRATLIEAALSR
jgi:hypothetical protein